jgi:hypothetical protein
MNHRDEEILILDLFRKNYPEFPKGKLVKSESPDFIVKLGTKKMIGIEITRLHDGKLPKNNPGFPLAPLTYENILASLKIKEEKLILYRKKRIEIFWLIITVDYIEGPKDSRLLIPFSSLQVSSSYDKIFLFDLFEKNIIGLK